MTRSSLSILIAAATLTVATIGPTSGQSVNGEGLWNGSVAFDQQVQQYISQNNLPGATVAVTRGGKLVLSKGYGYANLANQTQMQPWHVTYIGSASKVITAIGAMALAEAGKLDLEGPIYGTGTPLWSSDPTAPPSGIAVSGTSVLKDPGQYFAALREGVDNLEECFPPSACPSPSLLAASLYRGIMNDRLAWASAVRVKHLLSHTAGLMTSGSGQAVELAEEQYDQVTYKEIHLVILKALTTTDDGKPIPPYFAAPETKRDYSNHGFGLLGHIISEKSGKSYEDYIRERILNPLGLYQIVRGGTDLQMYATPYGLETAPFAGGSIPSPELATESTFGLAAGGWAATAQGLVRLMCGLDKKTTRPILNASSVATMESIAYPAVDSDQPLGWDERTSGQLRKNGRVDQGMSQIIKFLPGSIGPDEINIAITANIGFRPEDTVSFLNTLAAIVAAADIPQDYDLFESEFSCYIGPIDGTVTLRDNSPAAPACPRPAEVAASIRTNHPGEVPYVLACTGDDRNWEGKMTAHQTDENTFLGVVVHPMEITKDEEITCILRKGEEFGFADILATDKRHYPCQITHVAIPDIEPPPPPPQIASPTPLPPAAPDLSVKKDGPETCGAGQKCPFDITITNVGVGAFNGPLVVHDQVNLPGAQVSAATDGWSCAAGTCIHPAVTLLSGESETLTVNVLVPASSSRDFALQQCAALKVPEPGDAPVGFVQLMLAAAGIDAGPADNQMGRRTRAGIEAFRATAGLPASPEIDDELLVALGGLMPPDGNTDNNSDCVDVRITKTITCNFGFQLIGDACQPICTQRNSHYDGRQCVVCDAGLVWDAGSLTCVRLAPVAAPVPPPPPPPPPPGLAPPPPTAGPAIQQLFPQLLPLPLPTPSPGPALVPQQQIAITCTGGTVQGQQCLCPPRWTRQTVTLAPTAQIYNCVPPAR